MRLFVFLCYCRFTVEELDNRPDYLVLGHVSKDILPGSSGYAPGGTALYSALTAQRLGLQAAMVTALAQADDALLHQANQAGVWIHRLNSPQTTTFQNVYDAQGRRTQIINAQAKSILYEDVPPAWLEASIIHLGPVARELPDQLPGATSGLLGVTPQGWMRSWDREGKVTQSAWPIPSALNQLPANTLLVLSIEDLGYSPDLVEQYTDLAPLVVITQGQGEAQLYNRGHLTTLPAISAHTIDLTGAGDVFAAALFIRYSETRDLAASARFAHAAAACSIEGQGPSAIPDRATVNRRLKIDDCF